MLKLPLDVNLGTDHEPRIISVGVESEMELKNKMIALLNEYNDVFA